MKQLAILDYEILFDPSEAWTSGSQFEAAFADFFAAHGFEAQIIESRGGTAKRVIFLNKIDVIKTPEPRPQAQVKKTVVQAPTKDYKSFQTRGVPKNIVNQNKRAPTLDYKMPGQMLRQKVKI
jgi:hypothetical protein